ncbi:ethanolamine kinase 1-like [Lineus longissimus]|uniref:ethanolamine kinase 1-like n=1 Tax=Lineus longissimus TaxID=88925 RepID=UPI002B4D75F8
MATETHSAVTEVPLVDIHVDHENLENGVYQVLAELRSGWTREDIRRKYIDPNSAGANRTFVCYVTEDFDDAVVFRVHTDRFQQFVNREVSLKAFLLFNEIGLAPKLYCRLRNGICCEYVHGESFSKDKPEKLKDMNIAKNVARELAKIHAKQTTRLAREKYDITEENAPWITFETLMKCWPTSYFDAECQKLIDSHEFPTKEEFIVEKADMEKMLGDLDLACGLCHNDSGLGNVIFNEEKDRVIMIDYDICGYNYQLLDLAQYTVSAALGFPKKSPETAVRALFPPGQQRDICRAYLETLRQLDSWDRDVVDADVERLYVQLLKISFYFIIYGVSACGIMASVPNVGPGVSPREYITSGIGKWNWYKEEKERIMTMKVPDAPPRYNQN